MSGTSVSLSWEASLPAAGRIVGYRIYRDGAMTGQVGGTTGGVTGLASARSYEITVAAVDSLGYLSALSDPVTVSTDHHAPSAPTDLRATTVTDSAVSLTWSPGRRRLEPGHRLPPGPRRRRAASGALLACGGLQPRALDELRRSRSPRSTRGATPARRATPSRCARRSRRRPTATSTPSCSRPPIAASRTSRSTTARSGPSTRPTSTARPTTRSSARTTRSSRAGRSCAASRCCPRVNCQSPTRLHDDPHRPARRATRMIDALVSLVQTYDYDGVNLDFEAGLATDRPALTAFVSDVATRLHAIGKRVAWRSRRSPARPRPGARASTTTRRWPWSPTRSSS